MNFLKKVLKALLFAPVALFLVFEEWGWEPLATCFAALGRLPVWRQLERLVLRLPPWAALLAFGVPVLTLIPLKLLALYLLGEGHVGTGLGLILAAKVTGTALTARLFQLTQPALMKLGWFARLYGVWKPWKDHKLRQVRTSWPWRASRRLKQRARTVWLRWRAAFRAAVAGLRK